MADFSTGNGASSSNDSLDEEVEFYQKMLDAISDMVLCKGPNSSIVWANKAFRDYYGMTNQQLREIIDAPFNEPDFTQQYIKDDHLVFSTGQTLHIPEEPVTRQDGEVRLFNTIKSAIVDRQGAVRLTVGVSRDITEQKRIQKELNEYRRRLEDLVAARTKELQNLTESLNVTLHAITEGVVSVDPDGRITLINEAALKMVGCASEKAIGARLDTIIHLRRENEPAFFHPSSILTAEIIPLRGNLVRDNGVELPVVIQASPLIRGESGALGRVLVIRDVTVSRRLEAQLLRQQKLESVGTLAGGIAHDFNNFLQAILGNISMAQIIGKDDPAMLKVLDRAQSACHRAQGVTRQLLAFSRGGKPVKRVQPIGPIIQESAAFAVRGARVVIEFKIAGDLWNCPVDDGQISQVISNLVINAEQSITDTGTITVEAMNLTNPVTHGLPLPKSPHVLVRIADNGIGIPDEILPNIFDPYFTTKANGNGLGLATAYLIVKNHDGLITVHSKKGEGTEVLFAIPAVPGSSAPAAKSDPAAQRGKGQRVLLMDDDEAIREILTQMLLSLGYAPVACSTSDETISTFKKTIENGELFDCVILDLTMPGCMGGKEVFVELKNLQPGVKAIVSSGYAAETSGDELTRLGFASILAKPYTLEQLAETIQQVLGSKQQAVKS